MELFAAEREWHAHEAHLRRSAVAFEASHEHFLFIDDPCVADIWLLDATHGVVQLTRRRRRAFFSAKLLPDTDRFFFLHKKIHAVRPLPRE